MKWLRRADHDRRTKGDPPPTYAQLVAEVRLTQAALAKAEEVAANLRHQCDGLIAENARLRARGGPVDLPRLAERDEPERVVALDPDVTRPYVREPIFEWQRTWAPVTETAEVPDNDPWKDELR